MSEELREFNSGPWGAIVYLLIGAFLGAVVSTFLAVRAQRPRLRITGFGSGGSEQAWRFTISNHPAFFWWRLYGESAHDVQLRLWKLGDDKANYVLWWGTDPLHQWVTIEPGRSADFTLFVWRPGHSGYLVLDSNRVPIACFEGVHTKFVLKLLDRIGRETTIPITVAVDGSPKTEGPPALKLYTPWSFSLRWGFFRSGLRLLRMGLRRRSGGFVRGGINQFGRALKPRSHW